MSTNMGTIDRRLRGFLVAPLAVVLVHVDTRGGKPLPH